MKLGDLVYLVTGGSSGLGAATVRRLHRGGARVLICNRDSVKGESLAAELGDRVRFVGTDVGSESEAARAVETASRELGGLHGLVNCAGVAAAQPILGDVGPHPLEIFTRCLRVNLIGTFNMIRFAAAVMSRNAPTAGGERGVIVNTSSIVAYDGQIGHAAYAAANAGIIGMTLPAARELGAHGIRVVTIAPGPFHTPRLSSMSEEKLQALAGTTPFPHRLGHPEEYAALVQHVIQNEMLNGETIRLDGALRLAPS